MLDIRIGDNKDLIKDLESNSVQMIYFNPPFGTTHKEWDKPLDWDSLWPEMWRVLKPNGAIVIHCSIPFTWELIRQSWSKHLKYCWYWNKVQTTCFLHSNFAPLRCVEEVLVYYKKTPKFNVEVNPDYICDKTNTTKLSSYYEHDGYQKLLNKKGKKGQPKHYIEIPRTNGDFTRPKELIAKFIKHYTDEGDLILDPTCGMGRSGEVSSELNRKWIGMDIRNLK